ncbi:hypothetical protein LCGC14_0521240 [marine sediment metagenome]|uniref:Uncharacterized protein n=1 Tax=marine sediment metagenome TaxID=412755 RepID=A0A0F9UJZ3_9ZZZZ
MSKRTKIDVRDGYARLVAITTPRDGKVYTDAPFEPLEKVLERAFTLVQEEVDARTDE